MYTRCAGCHTVHPVNANLLSRAGGRYRCGKCKRLGDALEALFDEWPGPGESPPARGEPPTLGLPVDLHPEVRPDDTQPHDDGTPPRRRRWLRVAWISAAVVVLAAIAFELADFYGHPLIGGDRTRVTRGNSPPGSEPSARPFRDLSRIQLVRRELGSLPTRPGWLRLDATIVNRAERPQPYPVLEVVLLDRYGDRLSSQRFEPADYLSAGTAADSTMTPQAYLRLALDLPDPGPEAVGFELKFH